ncbi:sodium-coupled monocarboxylate transporter 1-like [Arctopsyche grandis]|uniref:sodium-coupled monocarboxylate transporter 1-like n=1 Tax=Arctopsyche grandis TaxID=121162 RepID=UPI00406D8E11
MDDVADVQNLSKSMQKFGWVDYIVFVLMLALSAFVGIYWGFFKKQTSQQDYLMGGRNMKVFPVSMSLVASFISGITLLGAPTEMYMYGTQYLFVAGGIISMSFVMANVYLPVFHNMGITSNYEYLEVRFNKKVRLFGSTLFTIALIAWLPIVIYVPALAFNQVTGVNVHVITPIVCIVCIFYTCVGGLQAVVWTDVIQILIMFGAMILVAIKGTINVGGISVVWERNWDSGRIEAPDFDLNPLTRHTVWGLVIGGFMYWLQTNSVNQTMMQRYLALPNLQAAKRAVVLFVIGILTLVGLCCYCGMLIYARYYDCDPLSTQLARAKDQLLPLLVMDVLGEYPGLSGIFVAGIFSAALSSLSTSLNSMSAVVLEDFYKPFFGHNLTDKQANILMKTVVLFMGALSLALVFVVEKMGTVLQLTMTFEAITNGPQLGIFSMGILFPWVNSMGALLGGISGLVIMSWVCLNAQVAIANGNINFPHKPLSTEGCDYNFTMKELPNLISSEDEEVFVLYRISYIWYTLVGAVVTVLIGLLVSCFLHPNDPRDVNPELLAPFLRKIIKPRPTLSVQPGKRSLIHAYEKTLEGPQTKLVTVHPVNDNS